MVITRVSMITGIQRTKDLPVTEQQMEKYLAGTHVQHAFPNLTAGQREFIISGITDEEWETYIGNGEEDEE